MTPAGDWIVFLADQEVDNRFELYAKHVRSDADPIKLSIPAEGSVRTIHPPMAAPFALTPDAKQVVYTAGHPSQSVNFLNVVPIDGSAAPTRLNSDSIRVWSFKLSSQGDFVIFSREGMLYRVPTDGAQAPTVLPQDDLDLFGFGFVHEFEVSPDDERVVYVTGNIGEFLYSVATDGSEQPVPLNSLYAEAVSFQISADSSRVVYQTGVLPCYHGCYDFHWSLHTVSIDHPDSVPLYLDQSEPFSDAPRYGISSDSSRVVFVSIVAGRDLFSAPLDGSQPAQQISTQTESIGNGFALFPDSSHVIYNGVEPSGLSALRRTPIDTSAPVDLSPRVDYLINPWDFTLSPDGAWVVYISGAQIYSAPTDGSSAPVRLNSPLPANGYILDFEVTRDSRTVLAYGSIGGSGDLRHIPIDGSQSSSSVSGLLAGAISAFAPSPLGTEAIYITDSLTAGMENLYIAPMDASTAPQLLTPDMVLEGDVRSFGLASSKSRLARSHSPTQIVTAEAPPGD